MVYLLDINQLYNEDCLECMKRIDDKSIDMIFTDLPYSTTQNSWGCMVDLDKLWEQYKRIIKDNGVIALWGQAPFSHMLACSNIKQYRYEWIIEKTKATGHLNAKRMPMKAHENVLIFSDNIEKCDDVIETLQIFYKKLPTYNPQMTEGHTPVHSYTKHTDDGSCYGKTKTGISGGGSTQRYPRDVLQFAWDTQKSNLHPCQKPVEACEYFIKTYTNQGDLVLDSTAGSMTTAISALNTGRNYICIEKDKEIFEVGKNRVMKYLSEKSNNCNFVENTERGNYCCYHHEACDPDDCFILKNGLGEEDLKGAVVGVDVGGYPIFS